MTPLEPRRLRAVGIMLLAAACLAASWHTLSAQEASVQQDSSPGRQAAAAERAPGVTDLTISRFAERSVTVPEEGKPVEFRYRLLRPDTLEPGKRYPLILFLHGAGERGSENFRQLKFLPAWLAEPAAKAKHPCFLMAPQCREGHTWADVDWSNEKSSPQTPEPTVDMAAAVAALDATLRDEPIDTDRIFLTGLSMGGYGVWDLATRMPDRFAAILPVCGGGDERVAANIAALPIWCFHGDADTAVPVQRSRAMIAAVRAAGGRPIYSELVGVGHDSWTPAYRNAFVLDWLFSQRR